MDEQPHPPLAPPATPSPSRDEPKKPAVPSTAGKNPPDQATIDALLQMTRAQTDQTGGTPSVGKMHVPTDWSSASPRARKRTFLFLAFFAVVLIVLALLTNYVVSRMITTG